MKSKKFPIHLTSNQLSSNSQQAITLANTKKLGEIKNKKTIYSPYEAFYLFEQKKAEIIKKQPLTSDQLIKLFSKKHKDFYKKYLIFKYLRKKGYIVKTALKFGGEFRIYEKKSKHAKWIVYPIINQKINLNDFIAKNRVAHQTAKKLLIAIVDPEEDILFYESDWIKP